MILSLNSLLYLILLNCEVLGGKMLIVEDNKSPTKRRDTLASTGNGTKMPNIQHEEEIVPNYLQSNFEGFISSDQGPTYNYEASGNKPKYHKKFPTENFRTQNGYQSYLHPSTIDDNLNHGFTHKTTMSMPEYSKNNYAKHGSKYLHNMQYKLAKVSSTYPEMSKDRSTTAADFELKRRIEDKKTKPLNLHRENIENHGVSAADFGLIQGIKNKLIQPVQTNPIKQENDFPVPEDRLPLPDISTIDIKNTTSARKPRSVMNFPGYLQQRLSSKRNGMSYRPQNDFHTMMSTMQNVDREDQFMDYDAYGKNFPSFIIDPLPILAASFLPLSMMVAAIVPAIIKNKLSNGNGNIPTVTTTATGNSGKDTNTKDISFLTAAAQAIEKVSPRTLENECMGKTFCKMINSDKHALFYAQTIFSELQRYMDSNWLDPLGLKIALEALKNGNCEEIKCH